ncbi:MAG: hypothetical protein M3Z84_08965 [Actinomycetota bacterium]|nr:hypothetical protein [Actinomycetota bacterium]
MSEDRDLLEHVLDLAIFAPLGLALSARERLPELAERGRHEIESRVPAARVVGQMALDQGTREVKKRVDDLPRRLKEVLTGLGVLAEEVPRDDDSRPRSSPAPIVPVATAVEPAVPPAVIPVAEPEGQDASETINLPIPGYDTLSASQVIQRLPGLSAAELDAVRSYEAARRGRKIVLLKVAQLRAAS